MPKSGLCDFYLPDEKQTTRLDARVQAIDCQLNLFPVAVERGSEELQEPGKAEKGSLERRGGETDTSSPFTPLDAIGDS
jgi:hypothetical protein